MALYFGVGQPVNSQHAVFLAYQMWIDVSDCLEELVYLCRVSYSYLSLPRIFMRANLTKWK